jgi:Zinc carboxypeptidase
MKTASVGLSFGTAAAFLLSAVEFSANVADAAQTNLPAFWKSRLADIDTAVNEVKKGQVRVLTKSAGGRNIYLVAYGEKQNWNSTANYNSAAAGGDLASYARKDGTQKPVIFLLGPVHGGEFEGIVGLVNLLRIAETHQDWRGREWKELAENFAKCRVLIVPSANPDGRARCPFDSWVGEALNTNERAGMGTQPDGTNYHWPSVKRIHPMRGAAVGTLGAYFNDDGINLMHDEWFDPMAPETRAWFKLAREEAPDFIVSLHSHAVDPSVEPTAYVPRTVKATMKQFGDRLQKRYADAGLPHRSGGGPEPKEDGEKFPPPSFNLTSALHHACGAVSFVFECPVGVKDEPYAKLTHEQILDLQLLMYDELFKFATERPVKWTK